MATPTTTPPTTTPALPRPPRAPMSPSTWALIACIAVLGLAHIGSSARQDRTAPTQSPIVVTVNVNTADEPPADEPPADEPPADEPPADEPPTDAADEPPIVDAFARPMRRWTSTAGSTVNARLVSRTGDSLTLATADREIVISLDALSAADRYHVEKLMSKNVSH